MRRLDHFGFDCRRRRTHLGLRLRTSADPDRLFNGEFETLFGGLDLQRVFVRIHPFRKMNAVRSDAFLLEFDRERKRRPLPSLIAIVGDEDALDSESLESFEVLVGEAFDAVTRRDILKARTPKRERVDQRFTK